MARARARTDREDPGATRWVPGAAPDHERAPRWQQILDAGRAFHRVTAGLPRPESLDSRTDWWAVPDRLAWADTSPTVVAPLASVAERLFAALAPLGEPQVVHGDLTGNVLLADRLPSAIIDIAPYWRPPAYAEGVVAADPLCWHTAPTSVTAELGVPAAAIARGLLFRLLSTQQRALAGVGLDSLDEEARRYQNAANAIGA